MEKIIFDRFLPITFVETLSIHMHKKIIQPQLALHIFNIVSSCMCVQFWSVPCGHAGLQPHHFTFLTPLFGKYFFGDMQQFNTLQYHWVAEVGGTAGVHLIQPTQSRLPRATYSWVLTVSKDRDSTTFLGTLHQCLTAFSVDKLFSYV